MLQTKTNRYITLFLLTLLFVSGYIGNAVCEVALGCAVIYSIYRYSFAQFCAYFRNVYALCFFGMAAVIAITSLFTSAISNAIIALLLFRFYILFVVVRLFIKEIRDDLFQYNIALISLFLALNTIFQFIVGYDFFGVPYFSIDELTRLTTIGGKLKVGYFLSFAALFQIALYYFRQCKAKVLIFASIGLCAIATALSGERAPLYLLIVTLCVMALITFPKKHKILTLSGVTIGLVLAILFLPQLYFRHVNTNVLEATKGSSHLTVYKNTIELIQDNFVFGNGYKTFMSNCNSSDHVVDKNYCTTHPHNWYLEILYEGGIIAFAFFLCMLLKILHTQLNLNLLAHPHKLVVFTYFSMKLLPVLPAPSLHAAWATIPLCMLLAVGSLKERL